jgi:hypothetical protein
MLFMVLGYGDEVVARDALRLAPLERPLIKLRMDSPFSLREKVRMRGANKFFPYFLFSSPQPSPAGEGAFFLNLMALTPERGNDECVYNLTAVNLRM